MTHAPSQSLYKRVLDVCLQIDRDRSRGWFSVDEVATRLGGLLEAKDVHPILTRMARDGFLREITGFACSFCGHFEAGPSAEAGNGDPGPCAACRRPLMRAQDYRLFYQATPELRRPFESVASFRGRRIHRRAKNPEE